MAGKKKLKQFAEVASFRNVLEPTLQEIFIDKDKGVFGDHAMKGKWGEVFFRNNHPITLELACGKGEYTVAMARQYPGRNFLGIDIKGARIWRGAKTLLEENRTNAGFLRTRIDFITSFFAPGEVSEIWITFPDPQPQKNRERKRLTSPMFIARYRQFLAPNGVIHLKTDSDSIFDYTLEQISEHGYKTQFMSRDIYAETDKLKDPELAKLLQVKTHYEKIFTQVGHVIKYVRFSI